MVWNDLLGMVYIQQQSMLECIDRNDDTKLYPFMQAAATITNRRISNLETVYQLALLVTRLIYESAEIDLKRGKRNVSFVFKNYTYTT